MAVTYVQSDRFVSCSAEICAMLWHQTLTQPYRCGPCSTARGRQMTFKFIWRNLSPDGKLLVLNEPLRYVPVVNGRSFDWIDDHQEVWGVLSHLFHQIWEQPFPYSQWSLGFLPAAGSRRGVRTLWQISVFGRRRTCLTGCCLVQLLPSHLAPMLG